MGAATGAMRCRADDAEGTRCVTGNLELDRYLREGGTDPSDPKFGGSTEIVDTGKFIAVKAALDLWTIASALFVIIFVLTRSKLRSSYTNWLIINAVFVCLLNAVMVDPILMDIRQNPDVWRFGSLYCYMLFGGPADILGAMVPLTLIMVIIERLIYIRSPGRQGRNTSLGSTIAMIIIPWVIMSVVTVFVVYLFKAPRFGPAPDGKAQQCTLEVKDNVWAKVTFASWFSLSLALPICIMNLSAMVAIASVCCAKIETSTEDAITEKKEKKAVKQASFLITVVTIIFTLAAIPSAVAYVTAHTSNSTPISFEIVVILQMAFRAAEPLMWLLLATDLRTAAHDMFCGWRAENKKRDEQTRLIKVTSSPTRTPE